jgi:23S rRNA pseudouridine1911/1915/1917 synthase
MIAFWEHSKTLPAVLKESEHYIVLYKPPRFHTAPLHKKTGSEDETLLEWAAALYPDILSVTGHKAGEGGLVHRLDYETQGVVLVARTQKLFDELKGGFSKEYEAFSAGPIAALAGTEQNTATSTAGTGFPPFETAPLFDGHAFSISSAFRPYGPGRKAVRPVTFSFNKQERIYTSEGTYTKTNDAELDHSKIVESGYFFRISIKRGFRHQIRCHLAWTGFPILNDTLYGGIEDGGHLALRAKSISFNDGAERINYTLEP